jgi:hypothetical protein
MTRALPPVTVAGLAAAPVAQAQDPPLTFAVARRGAGNGCLCGFGAP